MNISEHHMYHNTEAACPETVEFNLDSATDVAEIKVYTDLSEVLGPWTEFEATAVHMVFQSHGWLSAWQKHIGSQSGYQPQIIIGYGGNGAIRFILPLAIKKMGPVRILCYLGCPEASYQIGLYAPRFARSLTLERVFEFSREIRSLLPKFHVARFKRQPFEWQGLKNPLAFFPHKPAPSNGYAISLNADYQTLYDATRSRKSQSKIARRERKLAKIGDIEFNACTSKQEISRVCDILFAQKAKRFCEQGIANFLERPGVQDFYRSLCLDSRSDGTRTLDLHYYKCGDQVLATLMSAPYLNTEFGLINSMTDGPLRTHSPGLHALHHDIERLCSSNIEVYDLGVGAHSYKDLWSDREHALFDTIIPVNLMGYIYSYGSRFLLRLKRSIKNSKILWPAFVKLRARIFSLVISSECAPVNETL